jgi:F-type H+-transporting ATPase subunit b
VIARSATALFGFLLAVPAYASDQPAGSLQSFVWPAVNLVILLAVLVYFARKPLQAYFEKRRSDIAGELQSSADELATAESTYAKWQRRMIDLEGELDEIRATSRQRAEAERERIIQDARATAERIRNDATAAVELELRRAREILREEATQLAIELAGERLSREVTEADRDRLIDEFIGLIASTPDSGTSPREGA